jgi:hypothetical protein
MGATRRNNGGCPYSPSASDVVRRHDELHAIVRNLHGNAGRRRSGDVLRTWCDALSFASCQRACVR